LSVVARLHSAALSRRPEIQLHHLSNEVDGEVRRGKATDQCLIKRVVTLARKNGGDTEMP